MTRIVRFAVGLLLGCGFAFLALGDLSTDTWVQILLAGVIVGLLSSWSFSKEDGKRRPPGRFRKGKR